MRTEGGINLIHVNDCLVYRFIMSIIMQRFISWLWPLFGGRPTPSACNQSRCNNSPVFFFLLFLLFFFFLNQIAINIGKYRQQDTELAEQSPRYQRRILVKSVRARGQACGFISTCSNISNKDKEVIDV